MPPMLVPVGGLPRSGSTVLLAMLAQNPAHHVTPTSGLVDFLVRTRDLWVEMRGRNVAFQAEGISKVEPRVVTAMGGLVRDYYRDELAAGKTVFEKNRAWLPQIRLLEEVLGEQVKILITVRDPRAVVASFEMLHRSSPVGKATPKDLRSSAAALTIDGRARLLLDPGAVLGASLNCLTDAIQTGLADRLVVVPYRTLTTDPLGTLALLSHDLGLSSHEYDPWNVQQATFEDDAIHGMDLHAIRPVVEPPEAAPWEEVLPPQVTRWIEQEYGAMIAYVQQQERAFILRAAKAGQVRRGSAPPPEVGIA